jgi:hypothetical protein
MASLDVLPDSGADISVATLRKLGELQDNLKLIPRAFNGADIITIWEVTSYIES